MRRALALAAALALAVTARAQPAPGTPKAEDEAGDVSEVDKDATGPLRDRIPPVSGQVWQQAGRFELSPAVAFSFRDAFWNKFFFGGALSYHFTEALGLSLHGGYTLSVISGAAQVCTVGAGCRLPTREELTSFVDVNPETGERRVVPANRGYGLLTFVGGLELLWTPIYGKISLLAERVLHFNMYAILGPTFVLYGPQLTPTVGGTVGVGFRFFFNRWLALRLEVRDVIYPEQGDVGAQQVLSIRNQFFGELGFSFFLPTTFGGP